MIPKVTRKQLSNGLYRFSVDGDHYRISKHEYTHALAMRRWGDNGWVKAARLVGGDGWIKDWIVVSLHKSKKAARKKACDASRLMVVAIAEICAHCNGAGRQPDSPYPCAFCSPSDGGVPGAAADYPKDGSKGRYNGD